MRVRLMTLGAGCASPRVQRCLSIARYHQQQQLLTKKTPQHQKTEKRDHTPNLGNVFGAPVKNAGSYCGASPVGTHLALEFSQDAGIASAACWEDTTSSCGHDRQRSPILCRMLLCVLDFFPVISVMFCFPVKVDTPVEKKRAPNRACAARRTHRLD